VKTTATWISTDCENSNDGVHFRSDEPDAALLSGFTIQNAWTGIYCEGASPTIENNIVHSCNYGIYSSINWSTMIGSNPIIRHNLIRNNAYDGIQAYEQGGQPTIENNTIVNNSEYGIRIGFMALTLRNNIVTGNLYGLSNDTPTDSTEVISAYNDIWNNDTNYVNIEAGTGDISADPLFVSASDFHLQATSPCIDAGDPDSPADPDDTAADMGAFYFHQSSTPEVTGFVKMVTTPGDSGEVYYDGSFLSDDLAYLVTNKNRLYKTSDGGDTWIDISPEYDTDYGTLPGVTPKVDFYNENIGAVAFSVDDGANDYNYDVVFAYVWVTTDGGQTWSERFDVNEDQILHLQQVSETVTYVSGASAFGVSGNRWFKKIERNPGTAVYTLSSIATLPSTRPHVMGAHWLDEQNGIALGKLNYGSYTAEPFITHDGGASWTSILGNLPAIEIPSLSFSDQAIQMLDEDTFVLAAYLSSDAMTHIWRTDDGGSTWTEVTITAGSYFPSIHMADEINGIAVGRDSLSGCIRTSDGGASWTPQALPDWDASILLYTGEIAPDGTIWMAGSQNSIWKSGTGTAIQPREFAPIADQFALEQNYPNPFNPTTTIRFRIPEGGHVRLVIYDMLGKTVRELVNNRVASGYRSIEWDGRNQNGLAVPTGMYLYQLQYGNSIETRKMIFLK